MENKEFESLNEYYSWLQALPDPCSGDPLSNGEQDLEDGDGNQYHVVIQKDDLR